MSKLYILFLLILIYQLPVFSQTDLESTKNAVYLDADNNENANVQKGSINMDSINFDKTPNRRQKEYDTLLYKDVNRMHEENKSVSKGIEKKIIKNTSIGASYSTKEKSGQLKDSISVYSKYEKEHFGLTTSYSQDRDTYKSQGVGGGTISVAPEISINKHIKLKNVYSENMSNNQQKSEVVLSVRPFKDDRLDFDLGAGETFSNSNQPAKSQINIGTKIRF